MALFDWIDSTTRNNPNWHPIRARLQNDPYYRLQSAEEIAIAAELGIRIDVNQASVDDWLRLPGISIHQARSLAGDVAGELAGELWGGAEEDKAAVLSCGRWAMGDARKERKRAPVDFV